MKKALFPLIMCLTLFSFSIANAQDTTSAKAISTVWEKSLDLDLTVAQSSYSDSWTGGEAGNFSWISNANGIFARKFSSVFRMKNIVKLSFGQTSVQDKETKKWSKPAKSSDKIDLEALGLFNLNTLAEPFASLRFESQFLDASNEAHKEYIDPILITVSAGIARQIVKNKKDDIITRLGFSFKYNRNKYFDTTSTEEKTESNNDIGLESNTDVKLVLDKNLSYIGKITVYKALTISNEDEQPNDYWKAIDVNWENTISATVSKYIKVSLYAQLLYDKQKSKKGRFKETLSMGLAYKLF